MYENLLREAMDQRGAASGMREIILRLTCNEHRRLQAATGPELQARFLDSFGVTASPRIPRRFMELALARRLYDQLWLDRLGWIPEPKRYARGPVWWLEASVKSTSDK